MNDTPVSKKVLRSTLPLATSGLRPGMFVADLDCGWNSTPFLLQGLLLTNAHEIATITRLARHVTIDPSRSRPDAFDGMDESLVYEITEPAATSAAAAPSKPLQSAGADQHKLENYRLALQQHDGNRASRGLLLKLWWQSLLQQLRTLPGLSFSRSAPPAMPAQQRPDYIPDNLQLVVYPPSEATQVGLTQAISACDAGEDALKRVSDDLAAQRDIDTDALQAASNVLAENMIRRPGTMIWAAKMRDRNDRMYQHGIGVAIYLTALGRQLGFQREQLADLATIGLLLDLGKLDLDRAMLDKPGKLDAEEIRAMRTHVDRGVAMLAGAGVTSELVLRAIAEHHENIDGSGYPAGLAGASINIFGKMAAIADAYSAMVNPRPYAPVFAPYDAMKQLFAESDTRWFAPLIEQFVQAIGIFPVGSLVELSTGEVAIVVQHNRYRRLEPLILILTDAAKGLLAQPTELDMLKHNFSMAPKVLRIANGLPDSAFGIEMQDYYLRPA